MSAKKTESMLHTGEKLWFNLCTPTQIYAGVCVFTTLFNLFTQPSIWLFVSNVIFSVLIIWLLKYLCERGHTILPWVMAGFGLLSACLTYYAFKLESAIKNDIKTALKK